jgi:hypothetical protein
LSELAALRDQLKTGLSSSEPKEVEPTVAELAERIKALKTGNAVETTPERTGEPPGVGRGAGDGEDS